MCNILLNITVKAEQSNAVWFSYDLVAISNSKGGGKPEGEFHVMIETKTCDKMVYCLTVTTEITA